MKLLLALTPSILIGFAFIDTCSNILNAKNPPPASAIESNKAEVKSYAMTASLLPVDNHAGKPVLK